MQRIACTGINCAEGSAGTEPVAPVSPVAPVKPAQTPTVSGAVKQAGSTCALCVNTVSKALLTSSKALKPLLIGLSS